MGTGVAYRLYRAGFRVLCLDLPKPLAIRRAVAFASAIYDARITVEGTQGERIIYADEAVYTWQRHCIPVLADPDGRSLIVYHPAILVDAVMAKHNTGTHITDAPVVVALGPGFTAGADCHAVVETQRGHYLGHVLLSGSATSDTGIPGSLDGTEAQRVIRAPCAGTIYGRKAIGDVVRQDDVIAQVDNTIVRAPLDGVLRGLLHDGVQVSEGMKVGDIDPRAKVDFCYSISDKALAVAGGVLEAVFTLRERWYQH